MTRSTARPETDHLGGTGVARSGPDRRWLALAVIATAQLMTALDATIVTIALPSAQTALGFGDGARQWVITGYTLAFAGLLLLGGRVADTLGRRRAFLVSLVGFALASLLAGLAPGIGWLVAGRVLQGASAALLAPTALSLLAVTFTDPKERAKAFGVYGAVASSGAAVGLVLGGVLTEYFQWRWCLYVNVAIAIGTFAVGRAVLPSLPRRGGVGIDVTSAVLATGGLVAAVYGCSQAATHGWSSLSVLVPILAGVAVLAAFALRQHRMPTPLLPLRILADRNRAGAYLAAGAAVVGSFGMFLMLTYHLQVVLHYSPLRAGLAFLPLTLANSLSGYQIGSRLQSRLRPRVLITGGLILTALGLTVLTQLQPGSGFLATILPAEVLIGIGMGSLFPSVFALALSGVDQRDAGVGSALITTATQVGGSIGTAVLNTLAVTATATYLTAHAVGPATQVAALVHGYATATACAAAFIGLVAVACAWLVTAPVPMQYTSSEKENV